MSERVIEVPAEGFWQEVLSAGKDMIFEEAILWVLLLSLVFLKNIKKKLDTNASLIKNYQSPKKKILDKLSTAKIYKNLSKILESFGASRALILQTHNGESYLNKYAFVKFSTSFEVTRPGTMKVGHKYQNIPTTLMDSNLPIVGSNILRITEDDLEIYYYTGDANSIFAEISEGGYILCDIKGCNPFTGLCGYVLLTFHGEDLKDIINSGEMPEEGLAAIKELQLLL